MSQPQSTFTAFHNEAADLVAQMSTQEKAGMCSGQNFWFLKAVERLGVPSVMVTDGPHGLRKQGGSADHLGIAKSVAATCFPTAVGLASSWDLALLEEIGVALGEKAADEDVALLLGPGLNIKRHPLCGRNFEYFSEDPLLSGELAGAMVRGVQSQGVGACLKHYAVNNQEQGRMVTDVLVDERTLREIYLKGFERAVKNSSPWAVMCAYNRVNGEYCGDSNFLQNKVLRDDWGFSGLVVTDWGATNDRVTGLAGGLDLEMPGSAGVNDALIEQAIDSGKLAMADLDRAATRVVQLSLAGAELIARNAKKEVDSAAQPIDEQAHHLLARRAAAESTVLLKNDGLLPLANPTGSTAVIGEFAKQPRYQGAGSSQVRPTQLDNLFDALSGALGTDCHYAQGYDRKAGIAAATAPGSPSSEEAASNPFSTKDYDPLLDQQQDPLDEGLLHEAEQLAARVDHVVLVVGLPAHFESEGFDRSHLHLPQQHNELVRRVCAANANTVVVLFNGAPVLMPWVAQPRAIVEAYLGGQAGGSGLADVLLGTVNPSGKLAESFPLEQIDVSADANFPGAARQVQYREGLYVGYRYYDTARSDVLFPFGFGLSYTEFTYSDLRVHNAVLGPADSIRVTVAITNTGSRTGKEVVQLYSSDPGASVHRPEQELRAFSKVQVARGTREDVTLTVKVTDLAWYDAAAGCWRLESGKIGLRIGSSSRDIRLATYVELQIDGPAPVLSADQQTTNAAFRELSLPFKLAEDSFAALLGREVPSAERARPFHLNSTLGEVKDTRIGAKLHQSARQAFGGGSDDLPDSSRLMIDAMIEHMPLRSLMLFSRGKLPRRRLLALIALMNRRPLRALRHSMLGLEEE